MCFYSASLIDQAFQWVCHQRKDYHWNSDVWHLRFHRASERKNIIDELRAQSFHFNPVSKIQTRNRQTFLWEARDALVLKAIALYLTPLFKSVLSNRIFHLAGCEDEKRGSKAAIKAVYQALPNHQFVFRTDVKKFYASIIIHFS